MSVPVSSSTGGGISRRDANSCWLLSVPTVKEFCLLSAPVFVVEIKMHPGRICQRRNGYRFGPGDLGNDCALTGIAKRSHCSSLCSFTGPEQLAIPLFCSPQVTCWLYSLCFVIMLLFTRFCPLRLIVPYRRDWSLAYCALQEFYSTEGLSQSQPKLSPSVCVWENVEEHFFFFFKRRSKRSMNSSKAHYFGKWVNAPWPVPPTVCQLQEQIGLRGFTDSCVSVCVCVCVYVCMCVRGSVRNNDWHKCDNKRLGSRINQQVD